MTKGSIDPRLAEALRANPSVLRVTPRTVVFAPSFIEYALSQCLNVGKARLDVFREAGIDGEALGKDRLGTAFGNWLTKRKRGLPVGMPPGRRKRPEGEQDLIRHLEAELARKEALLQIYRQIERLDRRRQPSIQPPRNSKR